MSETMLGVPGQKLVLKRSRRSRKYLLTRAVTALIFAGLIAAVAESLGAPILVSAAYLVGLYAAGNAAAYALQGRFSTVLTYEGIEVRSYFRRVIPWSDVRAFRVRGLDQPELLSPDPGSAREEEPRRLAASAGMNRLPAWDRPADRSQRTPSGRVTVEVVRRRGRRLVLPAPIVAGPQGDSEFSDKIRQMEQWRQHYAGWQSVPPA